MMSLAARWIESGEQPADFYELAGKARFHPHAGEVSQSLQSLATDAQSYSGHWQPEIKARAAAIGQQVQAAEATFASASARAAYDERLWEQIRQAYAAEFQSGRAAATGDAVRRWLRMVARIHPSRLEDALLRLTRNAANAPVNAKPTPASGARELASGGRELASGGRDLASGGREPIEASSTVPNLTLQPNPPVATASPQPSRPRPPTAPAPAKPDDFALLWIVGSAVLTAILGVLLLFWLFSNRFPHRTEVAQNEPPPPARTQPSPQPAPTPLPAAKPPAKLETPEPSPPQSPPPQPPAPEPQPAPPAPAATEPKPAPAPPAEPPPAPPATAPPATALPPGQFAFGKPVHTIAWTSSGQQLAIGGEGSDVVLWNPDNNQEQRLAVPMSGCVALAFSPDGKWLAIGTADGTALLWNVAQGKGEQTLQHEQLSDLRALAWTAGSEPQLAIGDGAGLVYLFSAGGGKPLAVFEHCADAGPIQSLAASAKPPALLFAAHLDGTLAVWNCAGKSVQKCLAPAGAPVLDALNKAGSGNSKTAEVTTRPHDTSLGLWLALAPDGKRLAVAARHLELWELDTPHRAIRQRLLLGTEDAKAFRRVGWSADGKLLAVGSPHGTFSIVDPQSWTVLVQETLPAAIAALAWHPTDNRRLAVATADGTVKVVQLAADVLAQKAKHEFDTAKLLADARQQADDGNWSQCAGLLNFAAAFQLALADKQLFDDLRYRAKKAAQELVDKIQPKTLAADAIDEAAAHLQLALDIDPTGPLGKQARELWQQLPVQTPESLARAAEQASKASAGKRRPPPTKPRRK